MATTASNERRSKRVWDRLSQSYGARFFENMGPEPTDEWKSEIAKLSDEEIAYGLRMVIRKHPSHPPTLGDFLATCESMPHAQQQNEIGGPTIQEQLCEYAMQKLFGAHQITPDEARILATRWTYVYREWTDESRPRNQQRCAECVGVVIDLDDDNRIGFSTANMLADTQGHRAVLKKSRLRLAA